jgi:hypothetical protein
VKTRTTLASLAAFFAAIAICYAADANVGNWKLNEAKSKFSPGATKNQTVTYVAAGDNMKVIVDAVDKDGKAIHTEWTGKFDGKDYAVTGAVNEDTRAYAKVDDKTLDFTSKKGGKVGAQGRVVLSADGKSRTVTTTVTDPEGKKSTNVAVYDKQQ